MGARAMIDCICCGRCGKWATATGGGICEACVVRETRDTEITALRAELAAAKEERIATLTELQSFREHTTALAADNARLRAAAERLRSQVSEYRDSNYLNSDQNADNRARHESLMESVVLAAQALEALAWQQETGASVRQTTGGEFWCAVKLQGQQITNNYYADTPLGAVLAAMEGERDA